MYVGNKVSDKLEPIHQRIYCQRYSSITHSSLPIDLEPHHTPAPLLDTSDTTWKSKRKSEWPDRLYRNELGNFPPVESAANVMREIIYSNKESLSASMICSGWDPYKGY